MKYNVDCGVDCKLIFTPRKNDLTNTQVTISELIPGKQYIFKVSSKNKISEQFGNGSYNFENRTYTFPGSQYLTKTKVLVFISTPAKFDTELSNLRLTVFVGKLGSNEFEIKTEYKIAAGIVTFLIVVVIIVLVCILR